MTRRSAISVFLLSLLAAVSCQTPVIGGSCKLGTSDVQIGGKQTQFFLKCEAASDSADGEGVWVVKSRAASPPQQVQPVPAENSQPQARPPMRKMSNPNICEQDNGAREQDSCAVSATCLQAHNENPTFYLQCDQTNMRWVKKSCQDGFLFNFEQQTCVVPKRNNPINPSNLTYFKPSNQANNSLTLQKNCTSCPLGTICFDGQCKQLHTSTLCADGSSPLGQCPCNLSSGTVCTAQGVCCRFLLSELEKTVQKSDYNNTEISCGQTCSNASPCPKGLVCDPSTLCCYSQRFRYPLRAHDDPTAMSFVSPASVFLGSSSIFEPIKQGTSSAFRVISLEPSGFQSISGAEPADDSVNSSITMPKAPHEIGLVNTTPHGPRAPPSAIPGKSTTVKRTTSSMPPSIRPDLSYLKTTQTSSVSTTTIPYTTIQTKTERPTIDNCRGTNGNCEVESDCPESFICENSCCRLDRCPHSEKPVRFSCSSSYQCEAGETCLFGACCPEKKDETVLNSVQEIETSYTSNIAPIEDQQPVIEMKSHEQCKIDYRSPSCSLEKACPENSDCVFGVCCMNYIVKCRSGKIALSLPENCKTSEDCPIGSDCEYGSCCPNDQAHTSTKIVDVTAVTELMEFTEAYEHNNEPSSTTIKSTKTSKSRCLLSRTCSTLSLCPSQFTCTENKKCCRLNFRCPGGTVPESTCAQSGICPSSSQSCMTIEDQQVCCPTVFRDEAPIMPVSNKFCPAGSTETPPKFGSYCRYSLQCPSPYYCNRRGQPANPTGLVCTFASCSSSNPCSSGTCNNGYCCSSGSSTGIMSPNKRTNSTSKIMLTTSAKTKKKSQKSRKPVKKNKHDKDIRDRVLTPAADWPIGPPGYGFPVHLADLDNVLVPASGDGSTCAGGFKSNLVCSPAAECPPGLFCDPQVKVCCPLLLPLTDAKNPIRFRSRKPNSTQRGDFVEIEIPASEVGRFSEATDSPSYKNMIDGSTSSIKSSSGTNFVMKKQSFNSLRRNCCNMQPANSGCVGCNQSPPVITIPSNSCPGGGYAVGTCSSGYCSPGYSCVSGSCCPTYSQPSVRVYTCPSGTPAVGACMSGSCATGYSCVSGSCCPSTTTQNPFVCPDGTQAAGGCVNGQCGNGYTCSSGLCCAGTSNTVRCLDGSEAVGACIPSCQGNACGGSTVSYYCGSGYTCTTGNICCAINSCPNGGEVLGPTVNGLCPSGYVAQGSICCSASCPDGSTPTAMVNGNCIAGNTIQNGVCCPAAAGVVECSVELSRGGCVNGRCEVGYLCDTATQERCCPVVDLENPDFQIGPTMEGLCPLGFAVVVFPDAEIDANGQPIGTCISLQSVRDICKIEEQNGPCQNYQCSAGYTCIEAADVCCPSPAFRKLRPGQKVRPLQQKPVYGRPLHSYMPPRKDLTCPDGSAARGACMNGLCGVGHECINGLCCPPQSLSGNNDLKSVCPNRKTAVSGCFSDGTCGFGFECVKSVSLCCPPGGNDIINNSLGNNHGNSGFPMTIRPIGARCHQDSECVGHADSLSLCHAGVCQCSPIAYSQGIACVRRKALNMMMNDQPIDVEKTNKVAASN